MYAFSKGILSGKALRKSIAIKMFGKDSILVQAGGRPGYRAYFYMDLRTGVTFIFLSNYTGIPFQQVTNDIISIMENKPYEIPSIVNRVKIMLPENILQRYTGKFALEADDSQYFFVTLEKGRFFIAGKDGEKTEMYADTETTFFDDPKSRDGYAFVLNSATGRYELVIISTGMRLKTKRLE
jgi:hypothetical protein